ncbi:MAG: DMT family transporter [Pseudomonadota bacterium]
MNDTLKGVLWMLGTITSFSVMAVAGREVLDVHDTFEIMAFRSILGVLIIVTIVAVTGRWQELRTQQFGTHFVRNAGHFIGQNLWFYALSLITLSQVFALEFTTPLWVILLGPLLLGERFTPIALICAALGFAGILVVTRPGLIEMNSGTYAAMSSAIFFAISVILTKRLTSTESVLCILFYLTTIQLVFGLIASGYDGDVTLPRGWDIFWLTLIGLAGLLAHFCYTMALSLAPAAVVAPIDFARLPTIAIIGWLLYAENLDVWIFVGALLIFTGNYVNIWSATRPKS